MNPALTYLRFPRKIALWIISLSVVLSTCVSFTESYRALFVWATNHDVHGAFAYIWPLMIDIFIVVGEATLFVGMVDIWKSRARWWPWMVTMCGLAVSVAGNVGHVHTTDIWTRITAAVAPLAASASLTVGMGVLKRVSRLHHSTSQAATPPPVLGSLAPWEGNHPQPPVSVPERPAEPRSEIPAPRVSADRTDAPEADTGPQPVVREPESAREPSAARSAGTGRHSASPRSRSWPRERRVLTMLKNNPNLTGAEAARKVGVTDRHGQRLVEKARQQLDMV